MSPQRSSGKFRVREPLQWRGAACHGKQRALRRIQERMGIERLIRVGHGKLAAFSQLVDALCIAGALSIISWSYGFEPRGEHMIAAFWAVGFFIFFGHLCDLYHAWRGLSARHEFGRVLLVWAAVVTALLFLAYSSKTSEQYSRR